MTDLPKPNDDFKDFKAEKPKKEIRLMIASEENTSDMPYIIPVLLPLGQVVGVFGRGSTGKSALVATLAAHASAHAIGGPVGTLWISSEEQPEWITTRHIKSGGALRSLVAFQAKVTSNDRYGRAETSTFDAKEDLEETIQQAVKDLGDFPLRLVVLDTAVALYKWQKQAGPNSDEGVKEYLSFLQTLCDRYTVSIVVIGHVNKTAYTHSADAVMGSTAWTNSPRLCLMCAQQGDRQYVFKSIKTNFFHFAARYTTEAIHILHAADPTLGTPDVALVKVQLSPPVYSFDEIDQLWKSAVHGEDKPIQEPTPEPARAKVEDIVFNKLVEMVYAADAGEVKRAAIEAAVGEVKVSPKHWLNIDQLVLKSRAPVAVKLEKRAHGTTVYLKDDSKTFTA